jgi:hypothetical protein
MNQMKHYVNGVEIAPVNADNIGIRLDFTGDAKEAELNVDSIVLTNDAYKAVMSHINGSLGLFEGIPYIVEIGSIQLDYFIDLTDNAMFSDSEVELKIRKRRAIDWFTEQANGTSFELINSKQPITGIFDVPYIIVKDNQLELLVMLSISTYTLTKELIQATKDLIAMVTAPTIEASTPNAGVPPSMNLGAIITAVLKIGAQLVYTTAVALALYNTVSQLVELICPKVRYLKANKYKSLLEQGCQYLGYNFKSNLLDSLEGVAVLPVPLIKDNKSIFDTLLTDLNTTYNKGYPSASDTIPTLGSAFDEVKKLFNTQLKLIGDTIHLERWDYWENVSAQSFVNTLSLQNKRENQYTYNFGECWKRYYLHYQFDSSDSHTLDKINGLQAEYSTEPINVLNNDIVLIKGLVNQSINFSLAYRKEKLNVVEKTLQTLAQLCDSVVSSLGGSSSLSQQVNGRVGVIQISQQHFTTTKLIYTIGGKQPADYLDKIGATALYENYHYINQVAENLKVIAKTTIPFSDIQFEALLNNNYLYDVSGNKFKILTLEWTNGSSEANVETAEKSDKGINTKTIKIA